MKNGVTRRTAGVLTLGLASGLGVFGSGAHADSSGATYRWRNVKVGAGGFIPGIVFSGVERGLAYARSDMGGAYRFDAAAGQWRPLQDSTPLSSDFGVESIAADPMDPDVVHMAVGVHRGDPGAMLRSTDRGETWSRVAVPFRMGGNEDGRGLGERLAIDPNDNQILYFGSRHDGLQTSTDGGSSWSKNAGFPLKGLGLPTGRDTHGGLSFVIFDPRSGARGRRSQTLFVGVADPHELALYRSDDAGRSWRPVEGGPRAELSAAKAELDDRGVLYLTCTLGIGPNGVTDGAVWRLDTNTGVWTDITPPRPLGGFMGIAVDRKRPGVLMVSTLNRWQPGDTIWRSTNDGRSWKSLREAARHDVSATPYLNWGNDKPDFGWWIAALALDPFDSDRLVYATGATVYETRNLSAADANRPTNWTPWVEGIEQTAVITLVSPPVGPQLLTGFGDISGFAHEDLNRSPELQFTTPVFANTNQIDYAGAAPAIVVRSGTPHEGVGSAGHDGSTLAWSADAGRSWKPLGRPRPASGATAASPDNPRMDLYRDAPITVSADGSTFVLATPQAAWSDDRGAAWRPCLGLPSRLRPVADRKDAALFYALDFQTGGWFVSVDQARSFAPVTSRGLPDVSSDRPTWREQAFPLKATPDHDGDLWFVSRSGLFNSRDGGQRFARIDGELAVEMLDFGKPPASSTYPALFAIGTKDAIRGVFRSDDRGRSWIRVNDDHHEYGRRYRAIAGDPRVFGRVYVATDGRGVVYGEPA
ncbi:WD40/YVTN/BNR-like repeat-containing protein [Brevundimonas sp. SL130]|uniref:WD40/YVTN/BNR-like repeat-containing protein n=1 Tax=Brevundimonas sp. SL130 TaxID=2995143 RepID=UPI00226CFDA3|nr:sialidase family protein [Brevundimonas sp. SL130]WAC58722.1 sialidase family protein [Brevundimonas sp. SL130]